MRNKAITLLTITALVLGVSACGKKDVTSVVSEVTSVTEKVQETNTSIADKIDNINVDEKTDLSNLPEIEVPDVPDVPEVVEEAKKVEAGEVATMTIEEYNKEIVEYTAEYPIKEDDCDELFTAEMLQEQIASDYILDLYKENESLANVTLGDYLGEAIDKIPHANKNETFAEYSEAEDAYRTYDFELMVDDFMVENTDASSQFSGSKNLTRTDFHHDYDGSMALWKK